MMINGNEPLLNEEDNVAYKNLFACFIVLLVLLILSIIGGYYYYQRTNSPEHALEELQTAFEHRDN